MTMRSAAWLRPIAPLILVVPVVWVGACSTAEQPAFSDGACVAGGCPIAGSSAGATTTGSSSSGACVVMSSCTVSWSKDIFAPIIEGPSDCTSASCHGGGAGGITLTSGQAHEAYTTLLGYTLASLPGPAKPYIVPCDPSGSGFPCNMQSDADGGANSYGTCGAVMPLGSGAALLTAAQIEDIGTWIQCGAPEN